MKTPSAKKKIDFGASLDSVLAGLQTSKPAVPPPTVAAPTVTPTPQAVITETPQAAPEPPPAVPAPVPLPPQTQASAPEPATQAPPEPAVESKTSDITLPPQPSESSTESKAPVIEARQDAQTQTPAPQRATKPVASKTVPIRGPGRVNPNRVTVNLFAADHNALNSIAEKLKRQGVNFPNRSEVIKVALRNATKATAADMSEIFYQVKGQDRRFRSQEDTPASKPSTTNFNEVALILFPADREALSTIPKKIQAEDDAFLNRSDVVKVALRYSIHTDPKELARLYTEVKAEDKRFRSAKAPKTKAVA